MSSETAGITTNSLVDPIKKIISISATPMALFDTNLNIAAANVGGKKLLRFVKSVYPITRKSLHNMKNVSKKFHFKRKIWVLSVHPIFVGSGNLAGALVIAKED